MPTVLRIDGWRVVIYLNDHAPAHVHVLGPGWVVVVNLIGMQVREVIRADERTANEVFTPTRVLSGRAAGRVEEVPWLT